MLLDDHTVLRNALAFLLEQEGDLTVAAGAASLAEARAALAKTSVDVILVDLDLPDGSGLELVAELSRRQPGIATIVLTGSERPEIQALAVAAGAVGFLHKSTAASTLATAIRRVAAGESLLSQAETVSLLREAAHYDAQTQATRDALARLTPRERDVLRELAAGHDNQTIAARLNLGTETVRTHVAQVLRKLDVASRLQAAILAVRVGLVDPHDRNDIG